MDDIPCTIQDRRFDDDGSLIYIGSMHDRMMGMEGDTILVNGVVTPTLKAKRSLLRLRLHNGSNAQTYQLRFSDKRSFQVIASDGGFLAEPLTVHTVRLAVGERFEVLVDVSDKQVIELLSEQSGGLMSRFFGGNDPLPVMKIDATQAQPSIHKVPTKLRALTEIPDPATSIKTRKFELEVRMMGQFVVV